MLDEATLAKMKDGICPVCDGKMKKHSRNKLIVCKAAFKKRFGMKPATMTEYDDKGNVVKVTNVDDALSLQRKAIEDAKNE